MPEEKRHIQLRGGKNYISENDTDAYRVSGGSVLVFIIPLNKIGEGRRSFIYEAAAGEIIPSFCYRDSAFSNWRFCLVALEKADVEIIPGGSTRILKDRFAEKIKLKNYSVEGFNDGLVEQYRYNILREDILIKRNQNSNSSTFINTISLIFDSFKKKKINIDIEPSGDILYDSISLICSKSSVPIVDYDTVREAYGDCFEISDIARLSYFSYREIVLPDGWEKNDNGNLLVFTQDGTPLVCIPNGTSSSVLIDVENMNSVPVSKTVADSLSRKAYVIYRSLPSKSLSVKDLFAFCKKSVKKYDVALLIILTLITSVAGMIIPMINQKLYDEYVPIGRKNVLTQLVMVMISFMLSNIMISIVKNLSQFRIISSMTYDFNSAIYDRVFNMPESFFRNYESADLAQRVTSAGGLVGSVASVMITSVISVVYIIIYLIKMFSYSAKLSAVGILMSLIYAAICVAISEASLKYSRKAAELNSKSESMLFQFVNGIAKIRISGVEDRALYEYMKPYVRLSNIESDTGKIGNWSSIISFLSEYVFMVVFYIIAVRNSSEQSLTIGSFIAFTSMFGIFSASFLQLVGSIVGIRALKPLYERFKPIILTEPESSEAKELPGDITGAIEINNVSFSYSPDEPNVLDNLSLNIEPGDYVGIVGQSGCGKSTLMKLLLGFDKPTSGKIYYDNKDLENLDKRELRKKMGVVLQNGKLISGSIYDNITITAPWATGEDVNAVVKAVGLDKDIANMPMGLYTMLSEDCSTISGGQQQRILIARAIVSYPNILMFDEATSALDNISQGMVCDTLDRMGITRIVIAHRLSTIMKCNRIIVMDKGKIVEQGTYEELMEKNGIFSKLADRQLT